MEVKAKPRRGPVLLLILLVLILTAVVAVLLLRGRQPAVEERIGYESNVVVGGIPNMSAEERLALLNQQVQRGELLMVINTTPCTLEGGEVNWLIENPETQGKLIRVKVFLPDDTEDPIYETGFIQPGYHIEKAPLRRDLDPGTYTCSATFYLYDLDTEEFISEANVANMTLTVTE